MINGIPELEDLGSVSGKKVLVRVDFNVPIDDGQITDHLRISSVLPTISWLIDNGAKVTLCSHLGRPAGVVDTNYSLDPVRTYLKEIGVEAELFT